MSGKVEVLLTFAVHSGGGVQVFQPSGAPSVATDGSLHHQAGTVGPQASVQIFTHSGDLAAFKVMYLMSKAESAGVDPLDLFVELVTDADDSVGREVYTLPLRGGFPLLLSGDDSYANYSQGFAGGSLDKIQTITLYNPHATETARAEWVFVS